ncbi:hypothetical protein D9M71_322170 [compost metagenome]
MLAHKVAGGIRGGQPGCLHGVGILGMAAVEKGLAVSGIRIAGAVDLRVPVVTGEQLIGTLAALHHLAMLGHLAGQQVEGDAVVADHGLAHGAEGRGQLFYDLAFANAQLVMAGVVVLGDQVRILELVTAFAAGIFETDGEGRKVVDPGFTQQADQQARIDAA